MYTQCPQCNTVFRIHAQQLTQARGQVRCGICSRSFGALERLAEHLDEFGAAPGAAAETPAAHVPPPAQAEPVAPAPPFHAPGRADPREHGHDLETASEPFIPDAFIPIDKETAGYAAPWEGAAAAHASAPAMRAVPDAAAKISLPQEDGAAAVPLAARPDGALPDLGIIAAEPRPVAAAERPAGPLKTALWAVANIVLIAALLGQYAYFNRNELAQYPELQPWLARLCAALSCAAPLQRDVSRITLANRIVQSNPNHPNALLIDATLINEADFPQPYPLLEIRFSDLSNQLIAGRRFRPGEYLPAGASPAAGMPPHQPVHVRLEIVDPGKDAVSFQFALL